MTAKCLSISILFRPLAIGVSLVQAAIDNEVQSAVANSLGCGPECVGTCFAGNCLFSTENVDDGLPIRSAKPPWPQDFSATPTSAAWDVRQPGLVHNGADHSSVFLASKDQLSYELDRAQAQEAHLQSENSELRRELAQWQAAGAHIAEREAKVVNILQNPVHQKDRAVLQEALVQSAASSKSATSSHTTLALKPMVLLQNIGRHAWVSSVGVFRQAFIIAGVLLTVLCLGRIWYSARYGEKGDATWRAAMTQALGSNRALQPLLRRLGLSEYKIEISEIHLGSFFTGCYDIRISFRMGNGSERRTKVLKNTCGAFLRFDDVLELSTRGADSSCILCVGDRQGDLASAELPAAELIRLATRPHQEYFRTELQTCRSSSGDDSGRRPYIALRIRNITPELDSRTPTEKTHLKLGAGFAA